MTCRGCGARPCVNSPHAETCLTERRTSRSVVTADTWTTRPNGRRSLHLTVVVDESAVELAAASGPELVRISDAIRDLCRDALNEEAAR